VNPDPGKIRKLGTVTAYNNSKGRVDKVVEMAEKYSVSRKRWPL
jgi:hypothetical protein